MPLSPTRSQEAVADAVARAFGRSGIEVQSSGRARIVGLTDDIERLITDDVPREPDTEKFEPGTRVEWVQEDDDSRLFAGPGPRRGIVVGYDPGLDRRIIVDDTGVVFYRWIGLELREERS